MNRTLVMAVGLTALAAEAVYLPQTGPLPLRFQERQGPRAELPPLLPLAPTNEPVTVTNFVDVTNFVTVTITNVMTTNGVIEVASEKPVTSTNSLLIAPLPESQPMSPAVLMQYFRDGRRTNQGGTTIVLPLGFTPPPTAMPSSKATFEKK